MLGSRWTGGGKQPARLIAGSVLLAGLTGLLAIPGSASTASPTLTEVSPDAGLTTGGTTVTVDWKTNAVEIKPDIEVK